MKARKNPVLVSKTETKWQNFSLSSRSLRLGGKILVLVSKHEIERKKFSCSSRSTRLKERKSRSRLEAWDRKKEILDPVSDTRLKDRYSWSRLKSWNRALVGHWCIHWTILCSMQCQVLSVKCAGVGGAGSTWVTRRSDNQLHFTAQPTISGGS